MLTLLKPWSWTPTCVRCGAITLDGPLAAKLEVSLVIRGVEVQQHRAVLEALRPLGPAAGGVAAVDGEHGRGGAGRAADLDRLDALGRPRPEPLELRQQVGGRQIFVEVNHGQARTAEQRSRERQSASGDLFLTFCRSPDLLFYGSPPKFTA